MTAGNPLTAAHAAPAHPLAPAHPRFGGLRSRPSRPTPLVYCFHRLSLTIGFFYRTTFTAVYALGRVVTHAQRDILWFFNEIAQHRRVLPALTTSTEDSPVLGFYTLFGPNPATPVLVKPTLIHGFCL